MSCYKNACRTICTTYDWNRIFTFLLHSPFHSPFPHKFRFVAQIISHSQTYLNSNCLCPHLLHCLSACFCNQHPVNLFLHGFLCIFIEMIADNIYCLPDFLCKCVSFCFFIHHFFHNHLFPFFPVPDRERFASVPAGSLSARWQRKCQHGVWNFFRVVISVFQNTIEKFFECSRWHLLKSSWNTGKYKGFWCQQKCQQAVNFRVISSLSASKSAFLSVGQIKWQLQLFCFRQLCKSIFIRFVATLFFCSFPDPASLSAISLLWKSVDSGSLPASDLRIHNGTDLICLEFFRLPVKMVKGFFPDLDGTYMTTFISVQPALYHSCHRIFLCELFSVFTDLLLHFLWELQQAALILRWPVDFHCFCPQLVKIGSGFFFIIEDMLLCLTAVYGNRQEPSCPSTVKRNELPCVRWTCKDTLTLPVFLIFIIRVPVSVFLSGQEWLDFLIALL